MGVGVGLAKKEEEQLRSAQIQQEENGRDHDEGDAHEQPFALQALERFGHDERAVLPSMEGKAPCARREERSRTASAYEQVDDHEHPYEHTAPS